MFSWVKQEQGGRNKDGEMYQTVTEVLHRENHLHQPTTDGFIAVMYGENEGVVPGNALVVDPNKPFRKLNAFGNSFLNRFICSQMPNQVLQSISIIDTPGILSGEKQRISRGNGYDFTEVLRWFGERVDRIILLFDAHKLDISDEFSEAIRAFKGQDDKIRGLRRLMWSLGKVINTPEVVRVYLGSFWPNPCRTLRTGGVSGSLKDIQSLPRNAALRKLNDLIKRARLAKVHAYIISHLKKEMPSLSTPPAERAPHQPRRLPQRHKMQSVDKMLATKIAGLMTMIRDEESKAPPVLVSGGAFEGSQEGPFGHGYGEGICAGADAEDWIVSREKHRYDEIFYMLMPVNGKITGVNAKKE
ncbi:hypothetical protein F7725_008634 [Dissostichus mawsoni]|uniref:DUF5600 domain-containing protein n=1 Tax=Dissostichus mawsoni TaxID=36200 RepID=A0A7J5Y939_DISMA|nr:hypothetical protein F7725_008634 [Dissostichus mawsoni]